MELRICPECKKTFFTDGGSFIACPGCEYVLYDGRSQKRVMKKLDVVLYADDAAFSGSTIDVSEGGVKIIYDGRLVDVNSKLKLHVETMSPWRNASVVWAKRCNDVKIMAGLKFL